MSGEKWRRNTIWKSNSTTDLASSPNATVQIVLRIDKSLKIWISEQAYLKNISSGLSKLKQRLSPKQRNMSQDFHFNHTYFKIFLTLSKSSSSIPYSRKPTPSKAVFFICLMDWSLEPMILAQTPSTATTSFLVKTIPAEIGIPNAGPLALPIAIMPSTIQDHISSA